ncbi:MAG: DUF3859 domain-containing protein [Tabrizicola sp.]|jgi:hypothetical protein|nr:DUF3859 domain-containing protein [Tabrizicola sp.]
MFRPPLTLFCAGVLSFGAGLALADPAPPTAGPGIVIADFGIYCRQDRTQLEPAPGTSAGHVRLLESSPDFVFRQQTIPARLGISFGVASVADRDIPDARIEVWLPGAPSPEMWYSNMYAGDSETRGFTFDHSHELVTGPWRMEAWDGETLLYRIEFEILPGTELPGLSSDCDFVS